jgi:GNAT superfamily N-acetyltransferase
MIALHVRPTTAEDAAWIQRFIEARWRSDFVVSRGQVYHPAELPGFIAEEAAKPGRPVGLATYRLAEDGCEIVTIDSLAEGGGVGTALINAVVAEAQRWRCARVWLITTNDNLDALRFYQKRGFVMVAVHRNAVEVSRVLKPTIPLIGDHGIPLRDEIELEMAL